MAVSGRDTLFAAVDFAQQVLQIHGCDAALDRLQMHPLDRKRWRAIWNGIIRIAKAKGEMAVADGGIKLEHMITIARLAFLPASLQRGGAW